MNQTDFLKLNLPEGTDEVDITKFNENAEKLDKAIQGLGEKTSPRYIYVNADTGDDTNDGSQENPVRTIEGAVKVSLYFSDTKFFPVIKLVTDITADEVNIKRYVGGFDGGGHKIAISGNKGISIGYSTVSLQNVNLASRVLVYMSSIQFKNCNISNPSSTSISFKVCNVHMEGGSITGVGSDTGIEATQGSLVTLAKVTISQFQYAIVSVYSSVYAIGMEEYIKDVSIRGKCIKGYILSKEINELE